MSKKLLREYYALCDGGICQDLLTEEEKRYVADGGMIVEEGIDCMMLGNLEEASF